MKLERENDRSCFPSFLILSSTSKTLPPAFFSKTDKETGVTRLQFNAGISCIAPKIGFTRSSSCPFQCLGASMVPKKSLSQARIYMWRQLARARPDPKSNHHGNYKLDFNFVDLVPIKINIRPCRGFCRNLHGRLHIDSRLDHLVLSRYILADIQQDDTLENKN